MSGKKFTVPSNFDELRVVTDENRYTVSEEFSVREVADYLDGVSRKFQEYGYDFIREDYDMFYSGLKNFKNLTSQHQNSLWKTLIRALTLFENEFSSEAQKVRSNLLSDPEEKLNRANTLKMLVFSICNLMELCETALSKKWLEEPKPDGRKSAKKKTTSGIGVDNYEREREKAVSLLFKLLVLPIQLVFSPPVVEESLINCIIKCCWKLTENQSLHRNKPLVEDIFHIVGYSIEKYSGSLGFCLKIIQLLQLKESLVSILAQMVSFIVKQHNQSLLISEIIREIERIDIKELSRDSSGPRAISLFLCEVAEKCPREMLNSIANLLPFLEQDSYLMRSATLSIIGTVVSECLSSEKMTPLEKQTRDKLLDKLEAHVHDIGSFTRGRAIQSWSKLCEERKIPISRFETLMEVIVGRLNDKTTYVRKSAVHFLATFLKANIFGVELNRQAVISVRDKAKEELDELENRRKSLEDKGEQLEAFDPNKPWKTIEPDFIEYLKENFEEFEPEDTDQSINGSCTEDDLKMKLVYNLDDKKFNEIIPIYKLLKALISDDTASDGSQKSRTNENSEETDENEETEEEGDEEMLSPVEKVLNFCKSIYLKTAAPSSSCVSDETMREVIGKVVGGNVDQERVEEDLEAVTQSINKQESVILYLDRILSVIDHLRNSIPLACILLYSKNVTDVQEAIDFIITSYEFGLKEEAEAGLRKMITLIFTADKTKEEVIKAYRRLLIQRSDSISDSARAKDMLKKLFDLIRKASFEEVISIQELMKELVKSNDIDKSAINLLWDKYTMRFPDSTEEESCLSIQIIAMIASNEPDLVRKNLETLTSVGLGERGLKNLKLAQYTCTTLSKAMTNQGRIVTTELPYRFKNHQIFDRISKILVESFSQPNLEGWLPLQDEALKVIFNLAEHPDAICEKILYEMMHIITDKPISSSDLATTQSENGEIFHSQVPTSTQNRENESEEKENNNDNEFFQVNSQVLVNFFTFVGNVALNLLIHLEVNIFTELKTRNALKEESEKRKSISRPRVSMRRKSGRASLAAQTEEEELGLTGVVTADDAEAEFIADICNEEVVNKKGHQENLLYRLASIVSRLAREIAVSTPRKFADVRLESAITLTLGKMMLISEKFCESNLKVLMTIMSRSSKSLVRSNAVIVIGDLCVRFATILDSWTPRLYQLLSDDSVLVRTNTLKVISRLILCDMIKVQERISEIAKLMCDPVEEIASFARLFFTQLSKKLNAIYNVLPDIISRLSSEETSVSKDDFQFIMRFLFDLIDKERHTQTLVDKLCQRFKGNVNERQWVDLAFCLSLLKYSDKSVAKLSEHFPLYADKLSVPEVYELFSSVVSTASKITSIKTETKAILDELLIKMDQAKNKGVEDEINEGEDPDEADEADEAAESEADATSRVEEEMECGGS
ncbi:condensin complex subunit 1-like isoform X2 [Brevipalpus obovatus]|uniref:condensin complex subunit 1-like isoform X2 n=1 Tax=Brevipalpus obovatus TaxID=246614 RepID=UPI003D9E0120